MIADFVFPSVTFSLTLLAQAVLFLFLPIFHQSIVRMMPLAEYDIQIRIRLGASIPLGGGKMCGKIATRFQVRLRPAKVEIQKIRNQGRG